MKKFLFWNFAWSLLILQCALIAKEESVACHFQTETPIKYVVVIFPENRSFDHFFGTYPKALNPPGEPQFKAKRNTPTVNGFSKSLIHHNNNLSAPFRLDRSQALTCSPHHDYTILQNDAHAGLLDQFMQNNPSCQVAMGYYDGNTVTALWNYAQRFAMSDNFYSTNLAPSTPGHINLISGQTHGAEPANLDSYTLDGTVFADPNPFFDQCSSPPTIQMTGKNVGDLLNAKGVTWGWFQGGFRDCSQTHKNQQGKAVVDYVPHHEPFQYYASTSNPEHLPPSSPSWIGFQDQANHQYDLQDFWTALENHRLPAVSYLKPAAYQNCHAGNSDPLAFQTFLVQTVNRLQKSPEWRKMAIFIVFDDSGGWYDHVMPPIINQSQTSVDTLVAPGNAGSQSPFGGYQARLAYGMRLPFLVISPFAKSNYVSHTLHDQTSVLRFIEDNWDLGRIGDFSFDELANSLNSFFNFSKPHYQPLFLYPPTGLVKKKSKH
jgi:phospholipase C